MPAQNNVPTLSINLSKESYIEGELVYLVITLKNNGSEEITYQAFYLESGLLALRVLRKDSRVVPYFGGIYSYGPMGPDKILLMAHDQISIGVSINDYYPTFAGPYYMYRKIDPDQYTVQAIYRIEDKIIKSNTLTFTVSSPGEEDRKALRELENIYVPENFFARDLSPAIKAYKSYLAKYDTSPYAPFFLDKMVWAYHELKDTLKESETLKTLIRKHPDSGFSLDAIKSKYLSEQEKRELLQDVILTHPNGFFAKYAQELSRIKEVSSETK